MWKERVVAYFKILSRYGSEETQKNHKLPSPDRDSNRALPKHKSEKLIALANSLYNNLGDEGLCINSN
jgi:hypothetical protein